MNEPSPPSPEDPAPEPSEPRGERIDPERSACVLVGVSDYIHMSSLRSVRHSVAGLKRTLLDKRIWGIPEDRIWQTINPADPSALTDPIHDAVKQADDTLIVYYAGHGILDVEDEQLFLAFPRTKDNRPESAMPFGMLRSVLRRARTESGVRRCVLILDCCYSGRATQDVGAMAGDGHVLPDHRFVTVEGSYVLTSTSDSDISQASPLEHYTAFTGALIDALDRGDPDNPHQESLSLDHIHYLVRRNLVERGLPGPWCLDQNGVGKLPFVRNRKGAPQEPSAAAAPRRRTLLAVAAAAMAAGLLVGGVGGSLATDLMRAEADTTDPIPGQCGDAATLLDVSDRLDHRPGNEHMGIKVEGLSALALTGDEGGALALRDNEPAQLFSLDLGAPDSLRPEVSDVQMLYDSDGELFHTFDGEGLVLEESGKTALVSTEGHPSIRRFRLSDGRQVGAPLPLPEAFQYAPDGAAQSGRSLESLTVTANGKHLYAGMEAPVLGDVDIHGRSQVRIQRYEGEPGGDYTLDRQFGYQTESGLYLVELVAVAENRLLALERGYLKGVGNAIRVYEVDLGDAADVSGRVLDWNASDLLAEKHLVFAMATCPEGGVTSKEPQVNEVLQNVEGMALGPETDLDRLDGHRVLYLVADNNSRQSQSTRVYSVAVDIG